MTAIRARIRVGPDRRISGVAPPEVPPGEHEVILISEPPAGRPKARRRPGVDTLPTLDLGLWPDGQSLRREDFYGDDGR